MDTQYRYTPTSAGQVQHRNPRPQWSIDDEAFTKTFIREKVHKANITFSDGNKELRPFMKSWLDLINDDPQTNMRFTNMFRELPDNVRDDFEEIGLTDYITMIRVLDVITGEAPEYFNNGSDVIGVPVQVVLNYFTNTEGGMAAFMDNKVNKVIYKVLEAWGNYLSSAESTSVLNEGETGWLSLDAIERFDQQAGRPFEEMYICDKSQPHWGFASWDDFFVRPLRAGARPVDDDPTHITSPCESTLLRITYDAKVSDMFWLKKETPLFSYPYSLTHMLNHNEKYIEAFEGGTVYQAFLSALDYHRWHSPVTGTIEKIDIVPGTYYAAVAGSAEDGDGGEAVLNSQPFLTAVATRAIIYINAKSPDIGLVAFMAIGMSEISTCQVTVREGDTIEKGGEIGMFHYGGSSSCLIFNKETEVTWLQGLVDGDGNFVKDKRVQINTGVAIAKRKVN